ncbi:hypothetical protein M8J76_004183 [Diaphorina citri]|nr:hypothetical protein M8J76_004183 [Diaphorina citri]
MALPEEQAEQYYEKCKSKSYKDEEFEQFEKKVDNISRLIANFSNKDKNLAAAAMREAKLLLGDNQHEDKEARVTHELVSKNTEKLDLEKDKVGVQENVKKEDKELALESANNASAHNASVDNASANNISSNNASASDDVDESKIRVKKNKTVINQKAFDKFYEAEQQDTMSQDAFMRSVEIDAQRRFEERKARQEIADKFKANGNKAFQSGQYEAALVQYDKAIEQIRDSAVLYTNRALTLLHLQLYDPVLPDCDKALRLDEDNMKAHLYKARAMHSLGQREKAKEYVKELVEKYPTRRKLVENYTQAFEQE